MRLPPRPVALLLLSSLACRSGGSAPGSEEQAARPGARVAALAVAPEEGALGLGDPYFPGLGNGGYDVLHYDLVLDVQPRSGVLEARATLRVRALVDLASFSLDLYGLDVAAVRVDAQPATFEHEEAELIVRPSQPIARGREFELSVDYGGVPTPRPDPSVPMGGVGWTRDDNGIWVVSECIGASNWFPCNDHPTDKATFSFEVTVDAPYRVAANGILVEERSAGERRTYVWRASDPMATYLATLAVADFGLIEASGPRGIPLRTYHPTDAEEQELAPFRRQGEILEFLESRFGPYPFESAGAILAYGQLGGALECQTIPVYSRGCREGVIVHELAHQWFGDCVSPALWRDIWLNEGFASYAGWLWEEQQGGREAYERSVQRAYVNLRRRKTGPAFDPGVQGVFSSRVYVRGAMVLHGLRTEVGDELFFRILRTWVEQHHDGNASTADFVAHATATAGRDLTAFFEAWLYAEVTPEIAAWVELEQAEPESRGPRRRRPQGQPGEESGGGGETPR